MTIATQLLLPALLTIPLFAKAGMAQVPGPADCTIARSEYTKLSSQLLTNRGLNRATTVEVLNEKSQTLRAYIRQIVGARLNDMDDPSAIRSYLACMQEREGEQPPSEITNTPQIDIVKRQGVALAMSAMTIMRGNTINPLTEAAVQCFAVKEGKWSLVGELGGDFDAHTLFVHPLSSPFPAEAWFLLYGQYIGATTGALRLQVVSCSAERFRTVSHRDGIERAEIEVENNSVYLRYSKRDASGVFMVKPDKSDFEQYAETLHVTSNGLQP